jgi:hypothetical protein
MLASFVTYGMPKVGVPRRSEADPCTRSPQRPPRTRVVGKHGSCRFINFTLLQAMSEIAMATDSPLEAQDTVGRLEVSQKLASARERFL